MGKGLRMMVILFSFNPFTCIDKSFYPGGDLVVTAVGGIVGLLPGEDGTLKVGHHGEVATVGRADARHVVGGAIGIGRIAGVVVLSDDVVVSLRAGQAEVPLAVGHPDAKFAAAE